MHKGIADGLLITGTDTDVGKTVVSAILTLGLNAGYWKPIQSGIEPVTDTARVRQMTDLPAEHFFAERYCLTMPLSPHAAAEIDHITIDLESIRLPSIGHLRCLVVEGAGGVMVPLNRDCLMVHLIAQLQLPVVVVARSSLGTINHTLLTIEKLRNSDIPILGVVLNGLPNRSNRDTIARYGAVDILAELPPLERLHSRALSRAFRDHFGNFWEQHGTGETPIIEE